MVLNNEINNDLEYVNFCNNLDMVFYNVRTYVN